MIHKATINDEAAFAALKAKIEADAYKMTVDERPTSFPCVAAWHVEEDHNNGGPDWLHIEFVYPEDFNAKAPEHKATA